MKKLLVGLALLLAMGCGGKAIKKDLCSQVKDMPLPEYTVAADNKEYNQYMYTVGLEIAMKMNMGDNPACAYVNVFIADQKVHLMGEYCADLREDGLYMCEKACLYDENEVEKARSDKCGKVTQ